VRLFVVLYIAMMLSGELLKCVSRFLAKLGTRS
jgi:hypothetical protein